ncbi:MAG: hypothetical protein OER95_10980 [Acidimicrobiia bacterium]|nr:hypothetical protein [Acidimicrobiia bacterium]
MFTKALRYFAIVTLIGSFGVWIYAFSGAADRDPPDLLDDATWSSDAEAVCAAALTEVEEMPGALDADDAAERSQQVLDTTDRFDIMVDELAELEAGTVRDSQITADWLADWYVLLDDRRRYARAIVDDPTAPFTITDTGVGERLDKRITRFATTNSMLSCVTPTDV